MDSHIHAFITNSRSSKAKVRSFISGTIPKPGIKTSIGFIQPISLHGAPKLNISTLMTNNEPGRHKLSSFYVSDKEKEIEKPVEEKEEVNSAEDTIVRDKNDDGDDDDRGQGDEEAEEEIASEQEPVMRNAPPAEDELFYDFDDEELRVTIRK